MTHSPEIHLFNAITRPAGGYQPTPARRSSSLSAGIAEPAEEQHDEQDDENPNPD